MVLDTITGQVIDKKDYNGIWYSASLVKDFLDCPAKAFARITKQPQLNPGVALINGSAVHSGMEHWFKERKDPVAGYNAYFKTECEKQGLDWKLPKNEEVRLEGERMTAATWERFKSPGFLARLDPDLVEAKFYFMRDGRMFTGYLDLIYFRDENRYDFVDLKTGKHPPKGEFKADGLFHSFELDSDIQFNLYPYATYHSLDLKTHGIWPEKGVWFHTRGKNIGKEEVKRKDGTIGIQTAKKEANKIWQFDFPTRPTIESVEQIFRDTIDPVCQDIEDGRWKRNRTDFCSYCNYFDKKKEQCGAQLPCDGTAERAGQISLLDLANPRAA